LAREHEAQTAAVQLEADRAKLQSDAQLAAAQSEADRLKRASEAQLVAAQTEADRLKRENDAQRAASQADLDRAAAEKAQAEADKAQLRAQLLLQFNAILDTRDTARGLIVNMSDVLFDTAKFSLRPAAREKLARVAGILEGHPGLRMQVEGYTDSVGGDDYNQKLSENRATSVRDYLTGAGIPTDSVTARGFGKTGPVASNDTAAGRQQNRRVELVVSGDLIGSEIRPAPLAVK
jgi:outer membrane protein OmpA-like peptidoglycan-associated protein